MFNADISIECLIKPNMVVLEPWQSKYEALFSSRVVLVDGERFLHSSELWTDRTQQRKLQRAFQKLPVTAIKEDVLCSTHVKKHCQLVNFQYGFLCFLHLRETAERKSTDEAVIARAVAYEVGLEVDIHEELDPIDAESEKIEAGDKQLFPAICSLDPIDINNPDALSVNTIQDTRGMSGGLALPQLPYFSMDDGMDYVLMNDILHHFNLREDYCLAALAQYCEADKGFVDNICDKYLLFDSDCSDSKYKSGREILHTILTEAQRYERTLPSEEEFNAALHRLGLENMGKESSSPASSDQVSSSIALWKATLLEGDENQLIYVEEDEFLKRARGTRGSSTSSSTIAYRKDAALREYIKYLDHNKIFVFHHEFSKDNAKFPLFALKVVTRFCGGHEVPKNADRVVMIEKQFALRVFGQGLYCQALRAPYYIAYAAQALILGIAEAEQLPEYGKRFLMRSMKQRVAPHMLPAILGSVNANLLQSLDTSEEADEREQKRMKPTSSQP